MYKMGSVQKVGYFKGIQHPVSSRSASRLPLLAGAYLDLCYAFPSLQVMLKPRVGARAVGLAMS